MYAFTSSNWTDRNAAEYSSRIRKLSDAELDKQIAAGEFLCRPHSIPPRQSFVEQLRLAKEERERRRAA
jgi:hypothetical protein